MLAKKCDRCGKLYEYYDNYTKQNCNGFQFEAIDIRRGSSIGRGFEDLCKDCLESLVKWYEEGKRK